MEITSPDKNKDGSRRGKRSLEEILNESEEEIIFKDIVKLRKDLQDFSEELSFIITPDNFCVVKILEFLMVKTGKLVSSVNSILREASHSIWYLGNNRVGFWGEPPRS